MLLAMPTAQNNPYHKEMAFHGASCCLLPANRRGASLSLIARFPAGMIRALTGPREATSNTLVGGEREIGGFPYWYGRSAESISYSCMGKKYEKGTEYASWFPL